MDPSESSQQAGNPPPPKAPACDVKPRLTKEQHEILEQHFAKQAKPSTVTKKDVADKLQVSIEKINVSLALSRCKLWR